MKRALPLAVLLAGCTSSVFGGPPPVGCDTEDADGDGFLSEACLGAGNELADCDDGNADVFPGAMEVCNGRDDDCDGVFDEELLSDELYPDCDGDGVGGAHTLTRSCDAALVNPPDCGGTPGVWVPDVGDCDNTDPNVFPGATELCNGLDDNCDGFSDEGLPTVEAFADCDGDGVGGEPAPVATCDAALLPAPECPSASSWIATGGDCDDLDPDRQSSCGACGSVDLLFVMDDRRGAATLHAQLTAALPLVVRPLATGDLDGDGTPDTEPVASLQVGMVTADMGSRGFMNPGCTEPIFGDDGLLITAPAACMDTVPPYSSLDPMDDVTAFIDDALCHIAAGDTGCLYQQPLEATLRGLTPGSSLLRFNPEPMGLGHGDFANAGFLREDSILAVTTLTDDDDCSVAPGQEQLFNPAGGDFPPGHGRCHLTPTWLHLVERYISGLLALRSGEDLVFGLLAGIPPDLVVARPTVSDYVAIESDSRMTPTADPMNNGSVFPSCMNGGLVATPPARLTRVARGLTERGGSTVLGSVCDPQPAALAQALVAATLEARDRRCGTD